MGLALMVGISATSWEQTFDAELYSFYSAFIAPYLAWWFLFVVIIAIAVIIIAYSAGERRGERIERRQRAD